MLPVYVGAGVAFASAAAGPVAWPLAHQIGDLALLLVKTSAQNVPAPTGWTELPNSPQSVGVAATLDSARLHVFWRRANSVNEPDVYVPDSGDHQYAVILLFRGCAIAAVPYDATAGNTVTPATVAVSSPGLTTTTDDCLIVAIVARGEDNAAARFSGWANADLVNVTEIYDAGTATGLGGGFGVATGARAVAGVIGATTAALALASQQARLTVALRPEPPGVDNRAKAARIAWGPGLANDLRLGYPFDGFATGPQPREGSETSKAPSGVEDAWTVGTEHFLEVVARWIPQYQTASPLATGWYGATGFAAFLTWARDKNVFRFFPDAAAGAYNDCTLDEPMRGLPEPEIDGTRTMKLRFCSSTEFAGY